MDKHQIAINKQIFDNELLEVMQNRCSVRYFLDKEVPIKDINLILEAGRLSPSSFGLEQWKFIVVRTKELKDKLQEASYNQQQLGTSSFCVVILAKNKEIEPNSKYIKELIVNRKGYNNYLKFLKSYTVFVENIEETLVEYSKKQGYIAATNMMTMAAYQKIDSCAIGGFDENKVLEILDLKKEDYGVSLILTFGYRSQNISKKLRLDFDKVVEFR